MIGVLHPNEMSPDEIMNEVAALLAKGYWRQRRSGQPDVVQDIESVTNSSPLTKNGLDFPGHRSPNCDAG